MAAAYSNLLRRICHAAVAALAFAAGPLSALTLDELLKDPQMSPKRFAGYFEDFRFEYGAPVQTPGEFHSARAGDCDDYAILADFVLQRKGFDTRLIHVRMVGQYAHAVCYVSQNHAYLDYNNRKYFITLARCGPTIREIASKVADSLEANWTSASEFTYDYDTSRKSFGATVVKTDPPLSDPDTANSTRSLPHSHS